MSDPGLPVWIFPVIHTSVIFVFVLGLLCFFLRKEFIRQIFGLKLMLQSVSLGLVTAGWQNNDLLLTQSMVISALIIEAVVLGLALTMIIHIRADEDPPLTGSNTSPPERS